ncbi:branched-chain amino acid ABC transporter permease [Microbacterium soli]
MSLWTLGAAAATIVLLVILADGHRVAQTTLNGVASGVAIALGAVGLALIFSVLRVVNFAHGDLLTLTAYITLALMTGASIPLVVAAVIAIVVTASLTGAMEITVWRPLRKRGAGVLQKLLVGIGLAFLIRGVVQVVFGAEPRRLDVDVSRSVPLPGGLTLGYIQLWSLVIGLIILISLACWLKFSHSGRELRAIADNDMLAETTGINTKRWMLTTWIIGGAAAGLAGVLTAGSVGAITPNFGFMLLLAMFAATILGGVSSAFGAIAGGLVIGLVQEWSTMFFDSSWKLAVGFGVLILTLIVRPTGLLGKAKLS